MSIIRAFDKAFEKKEKRNWDKIYVFIDIHETILYPTYVNGGRKEFYPYAKETLIEMTKWDDISLGLYTCSHPQEIREYIEFFQSFGIFFEHINKNETEKSNVYGNFDTKPYFNVLIEDKAGFDGEYDWCGVYKYLKKRSDEQVSRYSC